MHVTGADRVIAGFAAAYMAYRLWSGMQVGVIYGDGDQDVDANAHPTAYVLTALSCVLVITLLIYIAVGDTILAWLYRIAGSLSNK